MGTIASQITILAIVYSTVYSDTDRRKYQSPASLAFVRGIHRRPVNSPHKWPVTRKMFPFDDVIMVLRCFAVARYRLILTISFRLTSPTLGNVTDPVPVKQAWRIWVTGSHGPKRKTQNKVSQSYGNICRDRSKQGGASTRIGLWKMETRIG